MMSWDYMEQSGKDGKVIEAGEGRNETLIGIDQENKLVSAIAVKRKGADPHATEAVGKKIANSGFNRFIMKSHREPAIRKWMEAGKNERAEEIDIDKQTEVIPETSPVAESKANGEVERYVQAVQGQVRTLKMSLETRCKMKFEGGHDVIPWLIMCAAMLLNICRRRSRWTHCI